LKLKLFLECRENQLTSQHDVSNNAKAKRRVRTRAASWSEVFQDLGLSHIFPDLTWLWTWSGRIRLGLTAGAAQHIAVKCTVERNVSRSKSMFNAGNCRRHWTKASTYARHQSKFARLLQHACLQLDGLTLQIILQELTPSEILMQRIAYECFPSHLATGFLAIATSLMVFVWLQISDLGKRLHSGLPKDFTVAEGHGHPNPPQISAISKPVFFLLKMWRFQNSFFSPPENVAI
jgi:hypothetical protein